MHVRRALALAVVGPLLLAGCTGDPEPTPKIPDPTTSSSTPSPTDSETPEAESAEDFIRRWSEALQVMQVTGQTEDFDALGPNCESCRAASDRVKEIYEGGGAIKWDGWQVLKIAPNGKAPNEFRVVEQSSPTRFRESPDADWQTLPGGRTTHVIELEQVGTSWLVVRTAELAS